MTKNNYRKLSILIPAYNEQETIIALLNKVKSVNIPLEKDIIIIDVDSFKDSILKLIYP